MTVSSPRLVALALAALGILASGWVAQAQDYKAGSLTISQPWSRATPAGAKVGGGYVAIENGGTLADRLVSVSAAFAGKVEVHEMAVNGGVMTMRPLEQGLVIPPGGKVELKPGGYHIMFMELRQPLKQDERLKGTLTFEKAGPVEVEFKVEAIGARGTTAGTGHKH